jgi:hypothetical protein
MPDDTIKPSRFLRAYPPWYARSVGWLLVAVTFTAAAASVVIRVPETVTSRFVLVLERDGALHAQVQLPESAFTQIRAGQRVQLLYDALPYQRWGARYGVVTWISPAVHDGRFAARVALDQHLVRTPAGEQALSAGLSGTARIVVGHRRLLDVVGGPLRALGEKWGAPT